MVVVPDALEEGKVAGADCDVRHGVPHGPPHVRGIEYDVPEGNCIDVFVFPGCETFIDGFQDIRNRSGIGIVFLGKVSDALRGLALGVSYCDKGKLRFGLRKGLQGEVVPVPDGSVDFCCRIEEGRVAVGVERNLVCGRDGDIDIPRPFVKAHLVNPVFVRGCKLVSVGHGDAGDSFPGGLVENYSNAVHPFRKSCPADDIGVFRLWLYCGSISRRNGCCVAAAGGYDNLSVSRRILLAGSYGQQ